MCILFEVIQRKNYSCNFNRNYVVGKQTKTKETYSNKISQAKRLIAREIKKMFIIYIG